MVSPDGEQRRIGAGRIVAFVLASAVWFGIVVAVALIAAIGECGFEPRTPCDGAGSMALVGAGGLAVWGAAAVLVFRRRRPA